MQKPDEKARAWTRPEDYWPPRRLRRSSRSTITLYRPPPEEQEQPRALLDVVPYAALMLGLAIMAAAIIAMAWPGNPVQQAPSQPAVAEIGTAPKGWIDQAEPARR